MPLCRGMQLCHRRSLFGIVLLLLRWFGGLDHGAVVVAHDEDGELGNAAHIVGVEAGVVKLPAQVGVAILVEAGASGGLGIDFHVDLGERPAGLGVSDLESAVLLDQLDRQVVRVVGLSRPAASPQHLDEDVLPGEVSWN